MKLTIIIHGKKARFYAAWVNAAWVNAAGRIQGKGRKLTAGIYIEV